jgi:hypothetical protein
VATRSSCATTRARDRARPESLLAATTPAGLRSSQPRPRGDPGLSWARRDDPPRRPGADLTEPTIAESMLGIGRDAVAAESVLALADTRRATRLAGDEPPCARARTRSWRERAGHAGGQGGGLSRARSIGCIWTPAGSRHGAQRRRHRGTARSRSGTSARNGPARTACASSACAYRSACIGIIYESRPNVTSDAGALCLSRRTARSCAAAAKVTARTRRSTPASSTGCAVPVCPRVPAARADDDRAAVGLMLAA